MRQLIFGSTLKKRKIWTPEKHGLDPRCRRNDKQCIPDQTAPSAAVRSWSTLPRTVWPKTSDWRPRGQVVKIANL